MHVISSYVDGMQMPMAIQTSFANRILDTLALFRSECLSLGFKFPGIVLLPSLVSRNVRRPVDVVTTISRATLVAVEPRAMATKGDQIGQREIGVIPHRDYCDIGGITHPLPQVVLTPSCDGRDHPPATAGGTDSII